jgi:predicted 3-demethylubiquinone-9 3-methyltransferase (glyoxalase superfamily)
MKSLGIVMSGLGATALDLKVKGRPTYFEEPMFSVQHDSIKQLECTVMTIEFELDGNQFLGLNGSPLFKFSPAIFSIIKYNTQEEINYFWTELGEGGKEGQCGWIDYDKFGVSWQIVPTVLGELMSEPDPGKSERVMKAMLKMKKIDIAGLKQ